MPVAFDCPHCHAFLEFADEAVGTRARCPECREPVRVPPPARCPSCSGAVHPGALRCKHCRADLRPEPPPPPAEFGAALGRRPAGFSPGYWSRLVGTLDAFCLPSDPLVCVAVYPREEGADCEMCGKQGIVWCHVLSNPRTGDALVVGSECIVNYRKVVESLRVPFHPVAFPTEASAEVHNRMSPGIAVAPGEDAVPVPPSADLGPPANVISAVLFLFFAGLLVLCLWSGCTPARRAAGPESVTPAARVYGPDDVRRVTVAEVAGAYRRNAAAAREAYGQCWLEVVGVRFDQPRFTQGGCYAEGRTDGEPGRLGALFSEPQPPAGFRPADDVRLPGGPAVNRKPEPAPVVRGLTPRAPVVVRGRYGNSEVHEGPGGGFDLSLRDCRIVTPP